MKCYFFSPLLVKCLFWGLGSLLYAFTAYHNIGFVALDDYTSLVTWIIPYQHHTGQEIILNAGIRSPLPILVLRGIVQIFYHLGFVSPIEQYRCLLLAIGLFSYWSISISGVRLFKQVSSYQGGTPLSLIFLFLISFYFLCPFFLSRAMIESLSTPFLFLSAYFACGYHRKGSLWDLLLALSFLTVSAVFRFQCGVVWLCLLWITFRVKKHMPVFLLSSAILFLLVGLIDLILRGQFHQSLFSYIRYNMLYSSTFGQTGIWMGPLLFFGCLIPPSYFSRYVGLKWRESYGDLLSYLLYFFVFLVAHSLIPHKEERFFVPLIPIFLVLITPMGGYLLSQVRFRRLRIFYFCGFNFLLLFFTSFFISQNNVVGLAAWLDTHPQYTTLKWVEGTFIFFPSQLLSKEITSVFFKPMEVEKLKTDDCSSVLVVREDKLANLPSRFFGSFSQITYFAPGPLEALMVKLNPRQNLRRNTMLLYLPTACLLL